MAVTITNISVDELPGIERQYGDGLIIQDCELNPYEAANVVNEDIHPWRYPRENGISEGYGFSERWPNQSAVPFLPSQIGNG